MLPITTDLTSDFQDVGLIELENALSDRNINALNILFTADNQIFTRLTELGPYYPPWVDAIVNTVSIRPLVDEQCIEVIALIHEFADIFALSVREVKPVDFLKFHLNIPKIKSYPMIIPQKPLTQAQKEWYFLVLDDFVAARVLREVHPDEIKAAYPTVIVTWPV